ncbi:MAG: ABC transporter ATP-binding protein [Candidatus Bathyarchaeia archaeon]
MFKLSKIKKTNGLKEERLAVELAIETNGLTKKYGSLTAVDKLNLKVEQNTIHGFLGPNGAGKSTTIKMLVGLLKASEGTAKIFGQEVNIDQADARVGIGYMSELPRFPEYLKGAELLDIYGRMYGMSQEELKEQIPQLIDLVGLKGRENDRIGKYSKGMQQRIGIAQALLNNPDLVILDEPSVGLDPVGMVEVRELVKIISKEGMTVLISSHLLFEVEQICSHVTIINKGKSLFSDKLENVSKVISGPASMQIEVLNINDDLIRALKRLTYVEDVTQADNTLNITLTTRDDVSAQISKTITMSGGTIVRMNQKGNRLEDMFIQLVNNLQGGKN